MLFYKEHVCLFLSAPCYYLPFIYEIEALVILALFSFPASRIPHMVRVLRGPVLGPFLFLSLFSFIPFENVALTGF